MIWPTRARDLLLIGVLALPMSASLAETRSFQKKFTVTPGGMLVVRSDSGDIRVVGAAASELSIVASIEGNSWAARGFTIQAGQEGNDVTVTGKVAGSWWRWAFNGLDVVYTIQVPEHFGLQLTTAGGDIEIRNVQGEAEAKTSGGDIRFRDTAGSAAAKTSGGDIRIERLTGDLDARTSGGDIVLAGVTGSAEVRTSGGDVRMSQIEGPVQAKTSGGDIDVLLTGNNGVSAETSGGDIEVRVGGDVHADLDAKTFGGSVSINLPIASQSVSKDDEIRGQINGGGPPIRARTSGGNIRIRAAR